MTDHTQPPPAAPATPAPSPSRTPGACPPPAAVRAFLAPANRTRTLLPASVLLLAAVAAGCKGTGSAANPDEPPPIPDAVAESLIRVSQPVDRTAPRASYRITCEDGLPDIPTTASQRFTRESATAGLVCVVQPAYPVDVTEVIPVAHGPDMKRYLAPSRWLETQDPRLHHECARRFVRSERTTLGIGRRLERTVSDYIGEKTLDVGFGSALDTLKSRRGDCTEHALLMAACARAFGVPSRVAVGMVYADEFVKRKQVFAYHMWTELWIAGRWCPFDAAQHREGGVGVGHVAMGYSDMTAIRADIEVDINIRQVVGRLRIDVLPPEAAPAPEPVAPVLPATAAGNGKSPRTAPAANGKTPGTGTTPAGTPGTAAPGGPGTSTAPVVRPGDTVPSLLPTPGGTIPGLGDPPPAGTTTGPGGIAIPPVQLTPLAPLTPPPAGSGGLTIPPPGGPSTAPLLPGPGGINPPPRSDTDETRLVKPPTGFPAPTQPPMPDGPKTVPLNP